jgi:hypothetical protein
MISNNSGATWTSVPHPYTGPFGSNFSFYKAAVSAATGQYMISSFSEISTSGRRIAYFIKSSDFGVTWGLPPAPAGFFTSNIVMQLQVPMIMKALLGLVLVLLQTLG